MNGSGSIPSAFSAAACSANSVRTCDAASAAATPRRECAEAAGE
jgi:hypothetical protein